MDVGSLTMRCQACAAPFDLPVEATRGSSDSTSFALHLDDADVAMFTLWVQSHRGPIGP